MTMSPHRPSQSKIDWLLRLAREEFWIAAKVFFAPIYGTALVLRTLDREAGYESMLAETPEPEHLLPAE